MGADELVEWVVFYEHEPWGYEVEERRHTQALVNAVNCIPRSKSTKPADWREFYQDPWGRAEPHGLTAEQWEFIQSRRSRRGKSKLKKADK